MMNNGSARVDWYPSECVKVSDRWVLRKVDEIKRTLDDFIKESEIE